MWIYRNLYNSNSQFISYIYILNFMPIHESWKVCFYIHSYEFVYIDYFKLIVLFMLKYFRWLLAGHNI